MPELPLEISCHQVREQLELGADLLLVDCREADELAVAAIEGAKWLPMSTWPVGSEELADDYQRPIVVYCHLGGRSAQLAAWLRQHGYAKAQSMAGGIDAWAVQIEPGMQRY